MSRREAFERAVDWPHRALSRFVKAAGLDWHVQVAGEGPVLLLIHGTGASTHSWRDLLLPLAERFTVVAPDLPGHGFTSAPKGYRLTLPFMGRGLAALLAALGLAPALTAGHSAGAPILVAMALDRLIAPASIISLNGALLPLHGIAGQIFSPLAKLMVQIPGVPSLFARQASQPASIERLLKGTGSQLDAQGAGLYARLAATPEHVAGALGMMANWDLVPIARGLPRLQVPLTLVVGERDTTILPVVAYRVRMLLPSARRVDLPGLGHLAHEEAPGLVVGLIEEEGKKGLLF